MTTPLISQSRDWLTGLPNRRAFFQRLQYSGPGAVLFIGVDNFAAVNHTLGFQVGDQLLPELAQHLKDLTPSDGFLARCGGDEFIAYVPTLARAHTLALQMAAHVRDQMFAEQRAQVAELADDYLKRRQPVLTVRIGVAPFDGKDMEKALTAADDACRAARSAPERVVVA
jgi:diguanylate cyclase (GGDEF)-like protein